MPDVSHQQRQGFGPGEDHNAHRRCDLATRPGQRQGFGPGEDHNFPLLVAAFAEPPGSARASALARITTPGCARRTASSPQRQGFGPGEDHNTSTAPPVGAAPGQRQGFGPGEDHNQDLVGVGAGLDRAAPGLRPWRGSQHAVDWIPPRFSRQRQGFGPGEDHNIMVGMNWMDSASSARASALARITTSTPTATRSSRIAAPGLRPWRGSRQSATTSGGSYSTSSARASALARITTPRPRPRPPAGLPQRQGFGPGEDHNPVMVTPEMGPPGSARASALARITTSSRARCMARGGCSSARASALARITTSASWSGASQSG